MRFVLVSISKTSINIFLSQIRRDHKVSETWLRPDISSRVLIFPGFTVTRCDRSGPPRSKTPRGGGVAILTREHLRTTKLDIGGADTAVESLWLSVTGAVRRTVIVGAIYRPPGSSTARGLELIEEQLRAAVATCKPVVVLGDFNFDMMDDAKPGTRDFKRIISDQNLTQLVDKPTHVQILNVPWSPAGVTSFATSTRDSEAKKKIY